MNCTHKDSAAGPAQPASWPASERIPAKHLSIAIEEMIGEVAAWEGVAVLEHRYGGVEFRFGRRELGHLHPSFADLPFPRLLRDELVAAGRAYPHHVLPDSGWITVPMRTAAEVAFVKELLRQNYDRAIRAAEAARSGPKVPLFY
jgi:Family of unknown function (DUF5519)